MAVDFPQLSKAMFKICINLLKTHLKMLRKGNKSKAAPNEEQQRRKQHTKHRQPRRKQHPSKHNKGENKIPNNDNEGENSNQPRTTKGKTAYLTRRTHPFRSLITKQNKVKILRRAAAKLDQNSSSRKQLLPTSHLWRPVGSTPHKNFDTKPGKPNIEKTCCLLTQCERRG